MSGGQVVNSAVRVPEQPFARARLALRVKIYCSPADALAIRAAGRQSLSRAVRPCCVHQTNIPAPKTARGRTTGAHDVTHKKALPQRTDDCIHPFRFANAEPFLRFILPKAADEGGGAPPFLWASKGLAPDLDRRPLPRRTGRQDGRFLKRLGRLFSGIGALFLNRNGREAVLGLPLPLAKTDRTVDGGA